jgi:hypothetical protein
MIALLLSMLVQAAQVTPLQAAPAPAPLTVPIPGTLPKQALPVKGCAVYLWSAEDRRLVAMAGADPATLRLVLDGKVVDIARAEQVGGAGFGFADSTTYRRDDIIATLAIQVATRSDLVDGAIVPTATLSLARGGGDALVVPVGGLIGCAKSPTP